MSNLNIDHYILEWINGHYTDWLDTTMWYISWPLTWIPLYIVLIGLLAWKYRSWKTTIWIVLGLIIAVGLSDYTCSGILKPLVCRLRPTHEPSIDPMHLVNGYTGGLYGFCSSHAANTMAIALLCALLFRNKIATVCLMTWVAVNCYSRMYEGAHYPSDIIVGLLIGSLWAVAVWLALSYWCHVDDEAAQQGGS